MYTDVVIFSGVYMYVIVKKHPTTYANRTTGPSFGHIQKSGRDKQINGIPIKP
jgi:hypothetical protein